MQYSVSGTVQSVSGNQATVKIDSVNGEPVTEEGTETPEQEGAESETGTEGGGGGAGESTSAMGARLRKAAKGQPLPF